MTKLLERAVLVSRGLTAERQDDIAQMILALVAEDEPYRLTPEERIWLAESRAQAARGEFATDERIDAIWAKHGL